MKRRRLFIILAVLALLLIPLAVFLYSRWTDISPVDDSDLHVEIRKVDPAGNPFPGIRSVTLDPETRDLIEQAYRSIRGAAEKKMTAGAISRLLSDRAEDLIRFEKASEMPDWHEDRKIGVDTDVEFLTDWVQLAKLKAVEAHQLNEGKDPNGAIDAAFSILRFGERLQHAGGGLIHHLHVNVFAMTGMSAILEIADSGRLDGTRLSDVQKELDSLAFTPEAFANAWRVEYEVFRDLVDDLAEGRIHIGQLSGSGDDEEKARFEPPGRFFFKPNRTVKLLADTYRQLIAEITMIRSTAPRENLATIDALSGSSGRMFLSGNMIGNILLSVTVPAGDSLNDSHAALRVALDLLRTRIALERFRVSNGDWPASLDLLVPEWLDRIPIDPMDGSPIRYNPREGVIYSVGIDFIDQGGKAPDREGSLRSRKEIVIELNPLPMEENPVE